MIRRLIAGAVLGAFLMTVGMLTADAAQTNSVQYTQKIYHKIEDKIWEIHCCDLKLAVKLYGDFSVFNDSTVLACRIGDGAPFTFYRTIGELKIMASSGLADCKLDAAKGTGQIVYYYTDSTGARTGAKITFKFNKKGLTVALAYKVDSLSESSLFVRPIYVAIDVNPIFSGTTTCTATFGTRTFGNSALRYSGTSKLLPLPTQSLKSEKGTML